MSTPNIAAFAEAIQHDFKGARQWQPEPSAKPDLQDQIDRAISTLEDAYAPETNREDLAEAVGNALDILKGEDEEDDDLDDDDDDDDDSIMD